MPHTDHGCIVLDPEHAVTLGKHILDFASAFTRQQINATSIYLSQQVACTTG
jgi:hypothetical protein